MLEYAQTLIKTLEPHKMHTNNQKLTSETLCSLNFMYIQCSIGRVSKDFNI